LLRVRHFTAPIVKPVTSRFWRGQPAAMMTGRTAKADAAARLKWNGGDACPNPTLPATGKKTRAGARQARTAIQAAATHPEPEARAKTREWMWAVVVLVMSFLGSENTGR
jgi:hypothetical protein